MSHPIKNLPSILDSYGMSSVFKVFGEGVARPLDWKNILPDLCPKLSKLVELFLLKKPIIVEELNALIGIGIVQALVDLRLASVENEHLQLRYRLLSFRGLYFFIDPSMSAANFRDSTLSLLKLRPSFGTAASFASLYSGTAVECCESARHGANTLCYCVEGQTEIAKANALLNGISINVINDFAVAPPFPIDAIVAAPPYLITLDGQVKVSNVCSGPLGSECLRNGLEFIEKNLSENGQAFIVGVSYGRANQGFDSADSLIKKFGLNHNTFVTSRSPMQPVIGAIIFHQTVAELFRCWGGDSQQLAKTLTQHLEKNGVEEAVLFSSLIRRHGTSKITDLTEKYYGLWTV